VPIAIFGSTTSAVRTASYQFACKKSTQPQQARPLLALRAVALLSLQAALVAVATENYNPPPAPQWKSIAAQAFSFL
jgi:hypothetical protein